MTSDKHDDGGTGDDLSQATVPGGLPAAATIHRRSLSNTESIDLLVVPTETDVGHGERGPPVASIIRITGILRDWVATPEAAQAPVVVPLYDCLVAWAPGRTAIVGPPDRLDSLETAMITFASLEAELRDAERRGIALLDAVDADVAASMVPERCPQEQHRELATRYHEAVAISRRLSLRALAIHAPPSHPPTLASQLGERLRDRARLIERHEVATEQAELAERVAEASRQRSLELTVARQQMGLEWAIIVLLVVQTALLLVDMLARRAPT